MKDPNPKFVAIDPDTGEVVDTRVIQEAGMGYDPASQVLDLSKDEKRRTTALMLAIQAYDKIIIKDAEYLKEAHNEARRTGSVIQPATMLAMVEAAIQFDAFISGALSARTQEQQAQTQPAEAVQA